MNNMAIYDAVRMPPMEALKTITAGRLKGKSDINPMWRIKKLTEVFGPCGIGWDYEILRQWIEQGADGELCAFCNINLFYRWEGEWSKPIPGTGGSMLVENERNGPHTSDEAYKMALTDAISVACKALGFAGDVYWQNDPTKYSKQQEPKTEPKTEPKPEPKPEPILCEECGQAVKNGKKGDKVYSAEEAVNMSKAQFGKTLCWKCLGKALKANADNGENQ